MKVSIPSLIAVPLHEFSTLLTIFRQPERIKTLVVGVSQKTVIAFTITSISVRIGQFLSEQSRTQLVHVILTMVVSERHQILFHKFFNEGYQCHNDSVLIVLTLF